MENTKKLEKLKKRLQRLEFGLAAASEITYDEWVGSRCYYHSQIQKLQVLCPECEEKELYVHTSYYVKPLSRLYCLGSYEKFLKAIKKEKEKIAPNFFMEFQTWKDEEVKAELIWEEPKEYVEEKGWEKEPATAKQIELLVKKGFLEPEVSKWSKGKASFEISKIL